MYTLDYKAVKLSIEIIETFEDHTFSPKFLSKKKNVTNQILFFCQKSNLKYIAIFSLLKFKTSTRNKILRK